MAYSLPEMSWASGLLRLRVSVTVCENMMALQLPPESDDWLFLAKLRRGLQAKRIPFVYTTLSFHRPTLRYHASLLSTTQLGWEPFIYAFPLRAFRALPYHSGLMWDDSARRRENRPRETPHRRQRGLPGAGLDSRALGAYSIGMCTQNVTS